jgi:RNA polymerase sigma factor (sigma-70 family)
MSPALIHQPYAQTVHRERVAAGLARAARDGGDLRTLLAKASQGDAVAWEAIVARFGPRLMRVARAHGLSRAEAEDAVQETWVQCLRNLHQVREPRALGGWLTTTARHESLRLRERVRREDPTADELGADLAAPDSPVRELEAAEARVAVARALDELPPHHRTLMEALLDDTGNGYKEIAERLNIPVGSIGPTRGRCLARMRRDERLRALAEAVD